MTITCTLMLVMFGFYLVKNSIQRDRQTGVGQIIATTPTSSLFYLMAKFLSNFTVLAIIVVILFISAAVMQLISGIEGGFNLWILAAPFLIISIPSMAVVAALAILFESIKWLRGGIGNVLYFFLIMTSLPLVMEAGYTLFDLCGLNLFEPSMKAALLAAYPEATANFNLNPEIWPNIQYFHWAGINWSLALVFPKLFLLGLAIAIVLPVALWFNRFDPAKEGKRKNKVSSEPEKSNGARDEFKANPSMNLSQLAPPSPGFNFIGMLFAELRLMLKGYHRIWYLVALGLLIAQVAAPFEIARGYILPIAWVWPLLLWSTMGSREARFGTDQILFSSAYPLKRQFPVIWLAGITLAFATGGGIALKAIMFGNWAFLGAWLVAAIFIPTLAITLGTLSGSNKLFEVVYMIIWYVGPLNHMPELDFIGATNEALTQGVPLLCLGLTLTMIPIMFLARKQRMVL
jgi:hypothetical protein